MTCLATMDPTIRVHPMSDPVRVSPPQGRPPLLTGAAWRIGGSPEEREQHPRYGSCDGFGPNGECSECAKSRFASEVEWENWLRTDAVRSASPPTQTLEEWAEEWRRPGKSAAPTGDDATAMEIAQKTFGYSYDASVSLGEAVADACRAYAAALFGPARTEPSEDTARLDWLDANAFTAYRGRDPEHGKLSDHVTLVDEDLYHSHEQRTGIVKPTLREAIDEARASLTPRTEDAPQ